MMEEKVSVDNSTDQGLSASSEQGQQVEMKGVNAKTEKQPRDWKQTPFTVFDLK